jgi:hypothetical protein
MNEEAYRDRFEVDEDEIPEKWSIIQSVFQIPPVEERYNPDAWPSFPSDPFFHDTCDLAILGDAPLFSRHAFNKFKEVLAEREEEAFVLMERYWKEVDKSHPFSFPSDISWSTFNDDRQQFILSGIDHFVVASSGQWGVFFLEIYNVYILAYKDEAVLRAFQRAYGFEGRGAEIVDPFSMKLGETRRLRKIADEIRAQEAKGNRG